MMPVTLAFIAAVFLTYAAVTRSWLTRQDSPWMPAMEFGLLGCDRCDVFFGHGGSMSNGAFVERVRRVVPSGEANTSSLFAPAGIAAFALSLLSALGLIAITVLTISERRPRFPLAPLTLASLVAALIAGSVFIATKPGPSELLSASRAAWALGVGAVIGLVAAHSASKLLRPEPAVPAAHRHRRG